MIDLVSCDPSNRSGVVEWPPSPDILEAAGGVGFGDICLAANVDPSTIAAADVIVPPVIRSLHPKLAAEGYERHRRDPLFLYKVCEPQSPVVPTYSCVVMTFTPHSEQRSMTVHPICNQKNAMVPIFVQFYQ